MQVPDASRVLSARPRQHAYDVVVVGGGLAGSSLGVRLAREGARVLVLEQQRYPAHKLCGEFLSPEAQGLFADLGVRAEVRDAGAHPIRRAALTAPAGARLALDLPGTALGLSRYALDPLLFDAARRAGAEAVDGCAVRDVRPRGEDFAVTYDGGTVTARLVLGAYGKRSRLDGRLGRGFLQQRSSLVGFKAHFEGVDLGDWIELHAFEGGYCGLSHVEGGRVNVCWITDTAALRRAGGTPEGMVNETFRQNPHLADRMAALRRVVPRYEAVSQVTFQRKGLFEQGLMMVGDTAAMITPFCGDGMAMALHTAQTAAPLALAYLDGTMARADFEHAYARQWARRYRVRLAAGRVLHEAFSRSFTAGALVRTGRLAPPLVQLAVRLTRGR